MKTKLLLAAIFAILPLALPTVLLAEGENSSRSGAVEFSCAIWKNLPYPELFYRHGGEYQPIELPVGQRSKAYPIKGAEALELFLRKKSPAGAAESTAAPEYERVGKAPLPKGAKRMLFLIEPKEDANGLSLLVLGMDDSVEAFPAGSFRFINQTPDLLRIEFGGTTCELPQDALKIVTPKLPEAGGFLPAIIKNEQGHLLLENRFLAQRTGRELVIISPPVEGRTEITIKFLSDIVPANPPSAKKPTRRK